MLPPILFRTRQQRLTPSFEEGAGDATRLTSATLPSASRPTPGNETVEIFIEANFETLPQERRRFAILNIPRHLFSEATAVAARRTVNCPTKGFRPLCQADRSSAARSRVSGRSDSRPPVVSLCLDKEGAL